MSHLFGILAFAAGAIVAVRRGSIRPPNLAMGFAALPASLIAGLLWEVKYAGVRMTFAYSAAVAVAAAMLFVFLCGRVCKKE